MNSKTCYYLRPNFDISLTSDVGFPGKFELENVTTIQI